MTGAKMPPNAEVRVGHRSAELALFWQRTEGDALAVLAGLVLMKRPVYVRHVDAAINVLRTHADEGARRFATMLERRTYESTGKAAPWYVDALPESVYPRTVEHPCAYYIEPLTKLRCSNRGQFAVPGARGSFCALHAHRTVSRIARKNARLKGRGKAGT